jgi:hypothetical protein
MRFLLIGAAMGVCGLIASNASAQLIVGNDQSGTATIWHVDVGTGAATALYSSSTSEAKPWGMAYDPGSNTLYWNNGSTLYKSPYSISGLTPSVVGTMMYNSATVNFVGLGFRDGMLLGTRNIATEAVYEIDPGALTASLVYQYSSTFDFGGLDVDAADDSLYGLTDTPSTGRGLYKIDTLGQSESFITGYPGTETDIDGLAVYGGKAYYVTDGPLGTQPNFYVYDVVSGAQLGTLPSPFTGSGTFSAAAYISSVPAPGTLVALGAFALTGMGRKRRR